MKEKFIAVHDEALNAEIARLKALLARAADALEYAHEHRCNETTVAHDLKLAAELRKAAE